MTLFNMVEGNFLQHFATAFAYYLAIRYDLKLVDIVFPISIYLDKTVESKFYENI